MVPSDFSKIDPKSMFQKTRAAKSDTGNLTIIEQKCIFQKTRAEKLTQGSRPGEGHN